MVALESFDSKSFSIEWGLLQELESLKLELIGVVVARFVVFQAWVKTCFLSSQGFGYS